MICPNCKHEVTSIFHDPFSCAVNVELPFQTYERTGQREWVSVHERLPKEGQEVEIYTTAQRRLIVKRRGNHFEFSLCGADYSFHWEDDVLCWREIGDPPGGEG